MAPGMPTVTSDRRIFAHWENVDGVFAFLMEQVVGSGFRSETGAASVESEIEKTEARLLATCLAEASGAPGPTPAESVAKGESPSSRQPPVAQSSTPKPKGEVCLEESGSPNRGSHGREGAGLTEGESPNS